MHNGSSQHPITLFPGWEVRDWDWQLYRASLLTATTGQLPRLLPDSPGPSEVLGIALPPLGNPNRDRFSTTSRSDEAEAR